MSSKGIGNSAVASDFGDVKAGCVRVQPAMHIARTIRELGADPERVFAGAGIPADFLRIRRIRSRCRPLGICSRARVAATGCEHFGLLLGAGADGNPLGLLGEIMEHCADVGTAIAHFHQYFHVHDRGGLATRTVAGREASIGYVLLDATGSGIDQINDAAIAIGMGLMRRLCGPAWKPTAVLLPRPRPRDVRPYENVFAGMPEFAAERAALVFPAGNLRRGSPAPTARSMPCSRNG